MTKKGKLKMVTEHRNLKLLESSIKYSTEYERHTVTVRFKNHFSQAIHQVNLFNDSWHIHVEDTQVLPNAK